MTLTRSFATAVTVVALLLAGCAVDVQEQAAGDRKDVQITSPFGDVSVRTNVEVDTGLRAYPGARPRREGREPESANVTVGNSRFGVKVVAAKFESDDSPETIAGFYRNELKAYGEVVECHGDLDFRNRGPVCRERRRRGDEIQLGTGVEERQRIVVLRPRGSGTEIDVVYVQTGGQG